MDLTSVQIQMIESKLASVDFGRKTLHEAVDHYVLKVKSSGMAIIKSQGTHEKHYLQVSMDLEKAILYLAEKVAEIKNNLPEILDVTPENTQAAKFSMTFDEVARFSITTSSSLQELPTLQSEHISIQAEIINKLKMMEEQMTKTEDGLKKLASITVETLESRRLDINRLEEKLKKFEGDRTIIDKRFQNIETDMATLEKKIKHSDKDKREIHGTVKQTIQQIEAGVAKVQERLRQSEEDGRETALTVEKRLTKLEEEIKSELKQMTADKLESQWQKIGLDFTKELKNEEFLLASGSNSIDVSTDSNDELSEVEVLEGQLESELQKKKECTKNPGHEGFMDISDFTLEHLSECYHDILVVDYIKAIADLVVRVIVKYISFNRPNGYFMAEKRGQIVSNFGSGWMTYVCQKSTEAGDNYCPCSTCRTSVTPSREWAQIGVETALKVVYDSVEAANTTCELFYDSEEVRDQVSKLEGVEVRRSDIKEDWCEMLCVTHDMELIYKLMKIKAHGRRLVQAINKKYQSTKPADDLAIVVSHPHGCRKQISLGKVTHRQTFEPYKLYYSAPTCPGSTGGCVCLPRPGKDGTDFSLVKAHSGGSRYENKNFCGGTK